MVKYVIKRLLIVIPIIFAIIFVLFAMLYVLPFSQISRMPAYGSGDKLDSVYAFFNAGDNFFTKYIRYCYNIIAHFLNLLLVNQISNSTETLRNTLL